METKQWAEEIARTVRARLSQDDDLARVQRVIAEELEASLIANAHPAAETAAAATSALPDHPIGSGDTERVLVSANGRNGQGIVAKLTTAIHASEGDIRDISQTLVSGYFTMIIVVDIAKATQHGARFADFKTRVEQVGRDIGIHVVAMHDDLLTAMHSV